MHFSQSCRPVSQNEDSSRSGVWGRWLFPSNDTSLLLPLPGRRGQRRTNAVSSSGSGEKEPTGRKLILLKKPEPLWLSHFPRGCTSYHHHHHKDKSLQGLQRDTNMQNMQKKNSSLSREKCFLDVTVIVSHVILVPTTLFSICWSTGLKFIQRISKTLANSNYATDTLDSYAFHDF